MKNYINILESAISDVGYWRWWAEKLPDVFQIEFGGVQLWNPPSKTGSPPSGIVAIRFNNPSVVAFLTKNDAIDLPNDWKTLLHEDKIEPFNLDCENFTLCSEEEIEEIIKQCKPDFIIGGSEDLLSINAPIKLAFLTIKVGIIVRAESMDIMSTSGIMSNEQIIESSTKWWEYWHQYWSCRDTPHALPKDYACEVTIPMKET
jgi:hypothetical protein